MGKSNNGSVVLQVRVSPQFAQLIDTLAQINGLSRSKYITFALLEYLKNLHEFSRLPEAFDYQSWVGRLQLSTKRTPYDEKRGFYVEDVNADGSVLALSGSSGSRKDSTEWELGRHANLTPEEDREFEKLQLKQRANWLFTNDPNADKKSDARGCVICPDRPETFQSLDEVERYYALQSKAMVDLHEASFRKYFEEKLKENIDKESGNDE